MEYRKKPLIGIACGYTEDAQPGIIAKLGFADQSWNMMYSEYIHCIERAGGIPLLIPVYQEASTIDGILEHLDGLLMTGGADLATECGDNKGTCLARDTHELALLGKAMERKLCILGVCRGCQALNVAAGGTLHQDLETAGYENHLHMDGLERQTVHSVAVERGSLLYEIAQTEKMQVNSLHHQAVDQPGDGFFVAARSEDGVVECIQQKDHPFVMGVQWHPELLTQLKEQERLFQVFVDCCGKG